MIDDLRSWLSGLQVPQQTAGVSFGTAYSVEVGQVRRLRSYDDDLETTLVAVLGVDAESGVATVVNVTSPADEATVRDLVVDRIRADAPFDLVLRIDGVGTAWIVQLNGTPIVASLSREVVDLARRASGLDSCALAEEAGELGLATGTLVPQAGGPLWWSIGSEAEHLARLTSSCHQALIMQIVADPAILPCLLLGDDISDWAEAIEVLDAVEMHQAEITPEGWDACEEVISEAAPRNQDVWRIVERRFLEAALRSSRQTSPESPVPIEDSERPISVPARHLPTGLGTDPLPKLIARLAHCGERNTRILTAGRLWGEKSNVFHTRVGGQRHAIVAQLHTMDEVGA